MSLLEVGGALVSIDPETTTPITAVANHELASGQLVNAYLPSEPTGYPGVIFCHQAGGNHGTVTNQFVTVAARRLAARGFACVAGPNQRCRVASTTASSPPCSIVARRSRHCARPSSP